MQIVALAIVIVLAVVTTYLNVQTARANRRLEKQLEELRRRR